LAIVGQRTSLPPIAIRPGNTKHNAARQTITETMNRRIVLIVMAAMTLVATSCNKKDQPAGEPESAVISIAIKGAPKSAVLVGEKFALNVEITPDDADAGTVVWSSSDLAVAKVNADGYVLATGSGKCEISATAGRVSDKVAVSVNDRDPAKDEMGHVGNGKTIQGQNNGEVFFMVGSAWKGYLFYQGGNNSMTHYDNGTFKALWSGTNDLVASVGYDYGNPVKYQDMQYDFYFRHSKTGSAGGYSFLGIHGWTLNPLVEFYIVEDWFSKPGPNLLGQKKGTITIDGASYDVYQNMRYNVPSIDGEKTFPQFFSVRSSSRQSGHVDISAHFKQWERLGMKIGNIFQLMFAVETGGGSGTLDCDYFYLSDGKF
jgi:hypothetical protein